MNLAGDLAGQLKTGPQGQSYAVEQGFRRLGLQLGPGEADALDDHATGRKLSPEQQAAFSRAQARMAQGPHTGDDLTAEGLGHVGSGESRQAGIRNTRTRAGQAAMSTVQAFEARAAQASAAFTPVIKSLDQLAPLLDYLVDKLGEATGFSATGSEG